MRTWATALAAVAAAAALGGCRGKSEETPQAVVAAIEGMAAVPASVDVVLGADVPALARAALVERAVARMFASDPVLSGQLDKLFRGCGFEPVRDVTSVLLAMDSAGGSGGDRALLVASGRFSEAALAACVGRHMSGMGGQLVQRQEAGRTHYQADAPPGRSDVWFAFGTPETVVVSSSPELLTEALGESPRLASDPVLSALVDRGRRPGAAIWVAGKVAPEIGEGLRSATGGQVAVPRTMFGHLNLENGLAAELAVELRTPEEAKSASSQAKAQLQVLAQVAQKWRLGRVVARVAPEAVGSTLFLRVTIRDDELGEALGPIDTDAGPDQNPAPPGEQPPEANEEGAVPHGQGDASPGGEAPVRKQGQAD